MKVEDARKAVEEAGWTVSEEREIQHATQLVLDGGPVVNVYHKGSTQVQGKDKQQVQAIEDTLKRAARPVPVTTASVPTGDGATEPWDGKKPKSRDIFVVYGHDTGARKELESLLRKWGLNPICLDDVPSAGQTIIEKLESHSKGVSYGIVLGTPDDMGHAVGKDDQRMHRFRQNVVLEMGMLLSLLGRPNVAILIKNQQMIEKPSDIHGIVYIPFSDHVDEAKVTLAKELNKVGFDIKIEHL